METENQGSNSTKKKALLLINCFMLAIGSCGGPLIMRLYFVSGGQRVWLSSFLASAGFPVLLLPLFLSYIRRRRQAAKHGSPNFFTMGPFLFAAAAVLGLLTSLNNYLYAFGVKRLPASTSALIIATQLVFTAAFAFLLVRQRFTPYSANAIVLLTLGAVVLALHAGGDRPANESNKEYYMGFVLTVGAAALYGFILPAVELSYKRAKQLITYTLVMELQVAMGLFGTAFCVVGMLANNDFKAIPREAREFDLGEAKYYVVLGCSAIIWQCLYLAAIGVVFCGSSFLCGVLLTVLLPVTEVLGVIFFREKFQVEKGISLALSLWGFASYFYGELKHAKRNTRTGEAEMPQINIVTTAA